MVGAGGCDSYAAAVIHEHARKLQAGESIERVAATDFHSWAQLHTPGKPDVVLDPWSQDPAMLAEDRTLVPHYSQGQVHNPEKAAHDLALARARVHTPAYHQYAADNLRQVLAGGFAPPKAALSLPSHFVDPALPARAELAPGQAPGARPADPCHARGGGPTGRQPRGRRPGSARHRGCGQEPAPTVRRVRRSGVQVQRPLGAAHGHPQRGAVQGVGALGTLAPAARLRVTL